MEPQWKGTSAMTMSRSREMPWTRTSALSTQSSSQLWLKLGAGVVFSSFPWRGPAESSIPHQRYEQPLHYHKVLGDFGFALAFIEFSHACDKAIQSLDCLFHGGDMIKRGHLKFWELRNAVLVVIHFEKSLSEPIYERHDVKVFCQLFRFLDTQDRCLT